MQKSNPWLVFPKPNPQANLRLFCLPYAGGKASIFQTWPEMLPAEVELCAIQLPGRSDRLSEPAFTSMPLLIEVMLPHLLSYLDKPFAVFGHSMGGLIGFELTRYLRRQHTIQPVCLFMSACRAPHVSLTYSPLHMLPDSAFKAALRYINGTPEPILQNEAFIDLLLPTLRADFALSETYRYYEEALLDCSICVFGGKQDKLVSYSALNAWQEQTQGQFQLHMLPGDHFFLTSAQLRLVGAISHELDHLKII
ncbi:MAG: thioesterase [Anaerolineae bacterium]|nr:thioesterase [Anaerolineae bacterium]